MRKLRSEQEIMASWKKVASQPTVSILCTAYNHELYIEDALKGFLNQETDFPFEIIVHDDASTDNTAHVVRKYRDKYPSILKVILQQENTYSKDKHAPLRNCLDHAAAELIALCEGDDFWINDRKLQLQVEALQQNPEFAMVVMPSYVGPSLNKKYKKHCYHGKKLRFFNSSDCILRTGGQFSSTASYLVRRSTLSFFYDDFFKEMSVSDLFTELYAIRDGGIIYLPVFSSFYRVRTSGSWSSNMAAGGVVSYEKYIKNLEKTINSDSYLRGLDWSFKQSYIYLGVSLMSLKSNDTRSFLLYVKKSKEIKAKKGIKFHVFYILARFPRLLSVICRARG